MSGEILGDCLQSPFIYPGASPINLKFDLPGATMRSIPVEVLRMILDHVDKADLVALCQVNKICCSCSQDALYREIHTDNHRVIRTLAHSTDLARRVRSFKYPHPTSGLSTALKNMSLLRMLDIGWHGLYSSVGTLDECTFKLDSFKCSFYHGESIRIFLNSQPSLTNLTLWRDREPLPPLEETCLPNLTQVEADPSSLRKLIPGRPVWGVTVFHSEFAYDYETEDHEPEAVDYELDFFTLSTAPIQKLTISYDFLFPKHGSLLASLFPSLEHLTLKFYSREDFMEWRTVRRSLFCLFI